MVVGDADWLLVLLVGGWLRPALAVGRDGIGCYAIGASMDKRSPKRRKVDEKKGKQLPKRHQRKSGAKGVASSTRGSCLVNRK